MINSDGLERDPQIVNTSRGKSVQFRSVIFMAVEESVSISIYGDSLEATNTRLSDTATFGIMAVWANGNVPDLRRFNDTATLEL